MNVTSQIIRNHQIYGASDSTAPQGLSASRSLNYAKGPSITRPDVENLNVIPFTFKYEDSVGLFGVENYFVRINVSVDRNFSRACFEGDYYECADIDYLDPDNVAFYNAAEIDRSADQAIVNTYEPAEIAEQASIPLIYDPWISVNVKNLKTGNKYIDNWLDVRLYTKDREEHPDDFMYVRMNDYFYLGFHARNTRSLSYNVELTVGEELRSGLPSTECKDEWTINVDPCACVEEPGFVCGEMELNKENFVGWDYAIVDPNKDLTTVESYQPARVTLQNTECIPDGISDILNLPKRGTVGQVPPPKQHNKKGHTGDPCCATC